MAMLAAFAAIASACSRAELKPVIRTEISPVVLPEAARRPCARPAALPDRDMTSGEVTVTWGADRAALVVCETRRAAAVAAVDAAGESR